jgi:hypothetical protein
MASIKELTTHDNRIPMAASVEFEALGAAGRPDLRVSISEAMDLDAESHLPSKAKNVRLMIARPG